MIHFIALDLQWLCKVKDKYENMERSKVCDRNGDSKLIFDKESGLTQFTLSI